MGKLVSESHFAFIAERQISDCFLCAAEVLAHNHNSNQPSLLLKIDFEKAFDNIDWSFLIHLLRARGFGPRWCQ